MIRWPQRARLALRKLFEPLQDIDVYVEDVDDEAFYRALINRASGEAVAVARVFGLGGRGNVLAAAATHDHDLRRALFIVDGDLSWVRGDPIPSIPGLHQHDAYCVENLLICEQAIAVVLSEELNLSVKEAKSQLALRAWLDGTIQHLTELFAAYATLSQVAPAVATVSFPVGRLCTQRTVPRVPQLDEGKCARHRDEMLLVAEEAGGQTAVAVLFEQIRTRIASLPDPSYAVSGKDYLMPLMGFHLQALGCKVRKRPLRVRLANTADSSRFSALAGALRSAAAGVVQ